MWMKWTEGVRDSMLSKNHMSGFEPCLSHFFRKAYGFNTGNLQFTLVLDAQEEFGSRNGGNGH